MCRQRICQLFVFPKFRNSRVATERISVFGLYPNYTDIPEFPSFIICGVPELPLFVIRIVVVLCFGLVLIVAAKPTSWHAGHGVLRQGSVRTLGLILQTCKVHMIHEYCTAEASEHSV